MSKNLLIIFTKNPELGKVKTRLAKTIGDKKALLIYSHLLKHTANFCTETHATKYVFYSNSINANDCFNLKEFYKFLQQGSDFGERMKNAFTEGFSNDFDNIIIIGSDCYDLTATIINEGFNKLNSHDFVLGPALDGGYYLLGMNKPFYAVFENKTWSTSSVFNDTLGDLQKNNLSHYLLPKLSDIDNENDLNDELKKLI